MHVMPYDKRDDSSGRFTPEFADRDFLEAVHGGVTTSDVADTVGCKYRTAYARLEALEESGEVTSRKIGNSLLWERDATERRETPVATPEPSHGLSPAEESAPARPVEEREETPAALLERDAFKQSVPASIDETELLEAIHAARDYVKDRGRAKKSDIVPGVMPEHPLRYDAEAAVETLEAGDRYRGKWWRLIRDGLKAIDDVEPPAAGENDWIYTGNGE